MQSTNIKGYIMYTEKLEPCKYCKRKFKLNAFPKIVPIGDDLFYAQCTNCNHYSKYEFPGVSKKMAENNWNNFMRNKS